MGRILLAAALLAAILLLPATASAVVDKTIIVGPDKVLSPPNVTVSPDGTVTWQWANGSIAHHIVSNPGSAEVWDSGTRNSGTFTHTFTKSGPFGYHCEIHPNIMRGTVTVTGNAPVAQLAVPAPNPAFVGDTVSFDATGSSDAEGPVVSYNWDFGDGSPVQTTAVETTSHAYATAGTFTAKVTAVDDHGNTGDKTQQVTVFSHSPTASFTATATSVAKNAPVTFTSTSVDHDLGGTIDLVEWDLGDGRGFVAGTSTATASYAAAGPVTVHLRVTDNTGLTGEATQTVTVTNQAPTATLAASTATPANGADVKFTATGADADGTVAGFQWDLDGNGTFETPGGTTPTITKAFSTAGPVSVRVRVTDNDGATGDATVSLTIAAPPSPPAAPAPAPAPKPAPLAPLTLATPGPVASPPAAAPLTLSAPAGQRLGRQRGVKLGVSCAGACKLAASGTVKVGGKRLRLTRAKKALAAPGTLNLILRVDKRDLRALKRARGKARASITVTATTGGTKVTQRLAVSLKG
ncbi:MAG TPA: PKD domain-containing protein [Solirubrobacteraceae bacterium]|jgi:plastocyanin